MAIDRSQPIETLRQARERSYDSQRPYRSESRVDPGSPIVAREPVKGCASRQSAYPDAAFRVDENTPLPRISAISNVANPEDCEIRRDSTFPVVTITAAREKSSTAWARILVKRLLQEDNSLLKSRVWLSSSMPMAFRPRGATLK